MLARSLVALLALLALARFGRADPKAKAVDIKPFRDKLVVLKDANGGIYVVANEKDDDAHVFYGTPSGKTLVLREQLLDGPRSWDGDSWSVTTQAPRVEYPFQGHVEKRKDGSFRVTCGQKVDAGLSEITGEKAKDILDKAQFLTTAYFYRAYLLARDDRGIYYYVDILRDQYGGSGHRVFIGKKGAMKQVPLTDVASDTAGEVFSTKTGDLRLVRTVAKEGGETKTQAQWIRGEKSSELISLDVYMNNPLIYRDLGVYKVSGAICDTF